MRLGPLQQSVLQYCQPSDKYDIVTSICTDWVYVWWSSHPTLYVYEYCDQSGPPPNKPRWVLRSVVEMITRLPGTSYLGSIIVHCKPVLCVHYKNTTNQLSVTPLLLKYSWTHPVSTPTPLVQTSWHGPALALFVVAPPDSPDLASNSRTPNRVTSLYRSSGKVRCSSILDNFECETSPLKSLNG